MKDDGHIGASARLCAGGQFSPSARTEPLNRVRRVRMGIEPSLGERLEERSAQLTALVESNPMAIVVLDSQGLVEMCNPAFEQLFQYSRAEIVGTKLDELIALPDAASEASEITQKVLSGRQVHITTYRRRKDGTRVQVEIHGLPLTVRGNLGGGYGLYQDVTERKRLEEQLQHAHKMQVVGRLAGGVAHDFNNNVGVIQGYAELLLERMKPHDPLRGSVEEILKAAQRSTWVARQLLALSRKQVLQPRRLDLNSVVLDIEKMLRRLIGEDIELVIQLAPDLGPVIADRDQLDQVIINLAANARDAMPQGGRLALQTQNIELLQSQKPNGMEPGSYVVLTVMDTGVGMDAETRSHIFFEPFFTTKELGRGTGLGLPTVYGIVKQSGGHISVESEPGRGSAFKIYLPRAEGTVKPLAATKPQSHLPRGSETILLVEDEDAFRDMTRKFLELAGYTVLLAQDGVKALEIAKWFPVRIHLALTDVVMPKMSGPEMAKRLMAVRPDLRVLYMSGYTGNAIINHGGLDPCTAFIHKPFAHRDLAQKVREVLDRPRGAGERALPSPGSA